MSDRNNRKVTYLTDEEASQLSEWADKSGKSESALLREAVIEYLDNGRGARIEEKVDRVLSLLGDAEHTHTRDGPSQSVPEKARSIARRCHSNHDMPMKGADVEIAIEDIAGGDGRTVSKYKEQLKKRGLLYEHPFQPVWTDSKTEFVGWVEGATVADVHEVLDSYSMTTDEYHQIAEDETEAVTHD